MKETVRDSLEKGLLSALANVSHRGSANANAAPPALCGPGPAALSNTGPGVRDPRRREARTGPVQASSGTGGGGLGGEAGGPDPRPPRETPGASPAPPGRHAPAAPAHLLGPGLRAARLPAAQQLPQLVRRRDRVPAAAPAPLQALTSPPARHGTGENR